jgi:hypothetical protein
VYKSVRTVGKLIHVLILLLPEHVDTGTMPEPNVHYACKNVKKIKKKPKAISVSGRGDP